MDELGTIADWRDAATYAPLLTADRSIFAWEWLRRDPGYRAAAHSALEGGVPSGNGPSPVLWGLHTFEPPDRAAPQARPVWRAEQHPYVLAASATEPDRSADALDLASFGPIATIVGSAGASEHLLLSDGLRAIRMDIWNGSLLRGPVQLRYRLAGFAAAERPLLSLRRLIALQRSGRFSRSLHPREAKARRLILMLRAYDALAAGADQREIAALLLNREAEAPRWRSRASSLRSQVQRLVRGARRMAAGDYRELLH